MRSRLRNLRYLGHWCKCREGRLWAGHSSFEELSGVFCASKGWIPGKSRHRHFYVAGDICNCSWI